MQYRQFEKGTRDIFKNDFEKCVFTDYLRRFAHGIDASCYRYIPKAVIKARSEADIIALIKLAKNTNTGLTFRASGTSLSGQASAKDVLVLCDFDEINILHSAQENAHSVRCGCSAIAQSVNDELSKFGKKIGPDPATIASARIGGIFSNNSSGMCCGVKQNSYQTIKSVRVILKNGAILDTSCDKKYEKFVQQNPKIIKKIQDLRAQILADSELTQKIKQKYTIKNTTGYSLNALVDFENTRDILNHIFIGAEGSLGFVSAVEYECVPDLPHKACALLFFEDIMAASNAILLFAKHQDIVAAAEIMDYACLESVKHLDGLPEQMQQIKNGNCLILIQLEAQTKELLDENIAFLDKKIQDLNTIFPVKFSFDKNEQASWWLIRKGILPIAAGTRENGASVIVEDVCFFIEDFTSGIERIIKLFERFDFKGIVFGHALSGNVHFIITPNLNLDSEKERFGAFMAELAKVVASFNGSIKAEHGTGRMVAPFIALEWGEKAYEINKKIKEIFDPSNIFNPDVIISSDSQIHLKNLKPSFEGFKSAELNSELNTKLHALLGKCMECGFCEKHCPSRDLTLTPRMRIAIFMEILRLKSKDFLDEGEKSELQQLEHGFKYFGVETCAACSACANLCPLKIDTANLAKLMTQDLKNSESKAQKIAQFLAEHLDTTIKGVKASLSVSNAFGDVAKAVSKKLNDGFGTPAVLDFMPKANSFDFAKFSESKGEQNELDSQNSQDSEDSQKVVYFSSCLNRAFAPSSKMPDTRNIQEVFASLAKKANFEIITPQNLKNLCCGKAFKDYKKTSQSIAQKTYESLKIASLNGKLPIVCDHSACSLELLERAREFENGLGVEQKLKIYDMPSFVLEFFAPSLKILPKNQAIALYAPCSTRHYKNEMNNESALIELAKMCAESVKIHAHTKCCGFAGNKGFLNPALNTSALEKFVKFYESVDFEKGFCSSSTCEVGLSTNTAKPWQHIIYLVDSCC